MLFKFIGVGLLVAVAIVYYFFFAGMSSSGDTQYVYIDDDDTIDSVYTKLGEVSKSNAMTGFKTLVKVSSYADNVRTGRYAVRSGEGSLMVFRHLKNGLLLDDAEIKVSTHGICWLRYPFSCRTIGNCWLNSILLVPYS